MGIRFQLTIINEQSSMPIPTPPIRIFDRINRMIRSFALQKTLSVLD